MELKKFKLHLTDGHVKTVTAKTPLDAENKYYNSSSHYATEYSIERVERCKKRR